MRTNKGLSLFTIAVFLLNADWRDIYEAERVTISPLKTAGAALGIAVAIPVIAIPGLASGCLGTYC